MRKAALVVVVFVAVLMAGFYLRSAPAQAQFVAPYCDSVIAFVGVPDGVGLTLYNAVSVGQSVTVAVYGPGGYVGGFVRYVAPAESLHIPLSLPAGVFSIETIWPRNGFAGVAKGATAYPAFKATVCR